VTGLQMPAMPWWQLLSTLELELVAGLELDLVSA
jgi:hypothetical protein